MHITHRLLDLFHSKGLKVYNNDHFRDILHADWTKSVWYLKQAVAKEDITKEKSNMVPAVVVMFQLSCRIFEIQISRDL